MPPGEALRRWKSAPRTSSTRRRARLARHPPTIGERVQLQPNGICEEVMAGQSSPGPCVRAPLDAGHRPTPKAVTAGHVKSDDLSTVVDLIDCGRPDAIGIIDGRKLSVVKDETVGETRRIYVRPNDLIVIVQAECLRER